MKDSNFKLLTRDDPEEIYIMIYQSELLTGLLNAATFMVGLIAFKKIIVFMVINGNPVVVRQFYTQHMIAILLTMYIIYYHQQRHLPYPNGIYQ